VTDSKRFSKMIEKARASSAASGDGPGLENDVQESGGRPRPTWTRVNPKAAARHGPACWGTQGPGRRFINAGTGLINGTVTNSSGSRPFLASPVQAMNTDHGRHPPGKSPMKAAPIVFPSVSAGAYQVSAALSWISKWRPGPGLPSGHSTATSGKTCNSRLQWRAMVGSP